MSARTAGRTGRSTHRSIAPGFELRRGPDVHTGFGPRIERISTLTVEIHSATSRCRQQISTSSDRRSAEATFALTVRMHRIASRFGCVISTSLPALATFQNESGRRVTRDSGVCAAGAFWALGAGCWVLGAVTFRVSRSECCVLSARCQVPRSERSMLGAEFWLSRAGLWVPGAECRVLGDGPRLDRTRFASVRSTFKPVRARLRDLTICRRGCGYHHQQTEKTLCISMVSTCARSNEDADSGVDSPPHQLETL